MIKIHIIAVGRVKEPSFIEAAREYEKRLGAFCELVITEIKAEKLPENPSLPQISSALKAEEAAIVARLPKNARIIPLCIEGSRCSSEDFAEKIGRCKDEGKSLCFIIGGSHGLSKTVKQLGDPLSFSDMTFPHRLFRVMLLEQIYRAFMINSGAKYHK